MPTRETSLFFMNYSQNVGTWSINKKFSDYIDNFNNYRSYN